MKSYGRRMAIDQYSLDGIYLKSFASIQEAASSVGFTVQTISNCLRGKRKQAHGFKWIYKVDLDLPGEVFLQYEQYMISNFGRIRTPSGKIAKIKPNNGYIRMRLKTGTVAVHRLVATLFVENPDFKPHVNHINGIKHDNHAGNLEWVTHQENMIHAELLHSH